MTEVRLQLAEFKALYKAWKRNVIWFDHLLLALLVWIEQKLIDVRVKNELDEAIEAYKVIEPSLPDMVTPVYTEKPSEGSTRLPEMRLTAPWYIPSDNDVKGR